MNDHAVMFFDGKIEHRTVKPDGLSYEDDYKGNALAAIITNGRIEIRNHRDFSVARVQVIMKSLFECAEMECLRKFSVQYHGKDISVGGK